VVDEELCAAFSSAWSQEEADAVCAELGGTAAECAEDELGRCLFEDGMEYVLYEMPPRDAESYCEYLRGVWLEPGEEPEDE